MKRSRNQGCGCRALLITVVLGASCGRPESRLAAVRIDDGAAGAVTVGGSAGADGAAKPLRDGGASATAGARGQTPATLPPTELPDAAVAHEDAGPSDAGTTAPANRDMGVADVGVPTATTSTLRLSAARDGYVEGSGPDDTGAIVDNANKSFAAEPVMLVKHRPDQPLVWRLAFVSFDIPAEAASSSVDRATLTVTGQMNDPMAASRLIVSSVPSPTWTEPTLTWSAEPAVGNPLGTLVVTGKPQALSLDVTSYARAAVEAGAKRIDFAIAQDPDVAYLTSARAELASREAGAAGPTLTIVARVARVARR